MVRLGVTGGIGSGKTYVCHLLNNKFGIPVYCCDIRAALLMRSDMEVIEQLKALVPHLYDSDGELDKRRLAAYMFSSEDNLRRVNAIVHPVVRRDLREWLSSRSEEVVAVESAILYESRFDAEVDQVIFVDAPLDLRISRIRQRDGLSEQEILQRIRHQQSELARGRADYVIINDGRHDLIPGLARVLKSFNYSLPTLNS